MWSHSLKNQTQRESSTTIHGVVHDKQKDEDIFLKSYIEPQLNICEIEMWWWCKIMKRDLDWLLIHHKRYSCSYDWIEGIVDASIINQWDVRRKRKLGRVVELRNF